MLENAIGSEIRAGNVYKTRRAWLVTEVQPNRRRP
jgi:hypothetical protein